jgi:hypothetical protein
MMGFPKSGLSLESAATADAYKTDASLFKNNLVHALADPYKVDATAASIITAAELRTKAEANGCITYNNANDLMLEAPFDFDSPNYLPKAGSPALAGAGFSGLDATFFNTVNYRGAFGATNWLTGWANFTPQTNSY